jgi:NhaP-type Na+/H+ or K+/H+ antiporter
MDRRLKFWDAMEISRRVTGKQFWRILGLVIVLGIISFAGACCCYVGTFFVQPFIWAAIAYAYEDLFNEVPRETSQLT